ncbi:hypothetical protein HYH03_008642 [Edaphochlamys debaryana]|uniref:Uncharacterized protein n=1 Tax=Edaphochlamys debaryana TaxID=47281 RepID=A0A836BXX3_9CHLO|nr:hypothetical protein HYH03_008642 [Edaphochlamys debaryana]|eukprot:KAG2493226.1 hypothetical protein HYH03_008642 [Edaphochlamys debaryana]
MLHASTPSACSQVRRSSARPFTPSALPPAGSLSRRTASAAILLAMSTSPACPSPASASPAPRASIATAAAAAAPGQAAARVAGQPANLDLLVVGPGVLGSVLGKDWLGSVEGSSATGLTNTDKSHDRLRAMGLHPATRSSLEATHGGKRYSFVAFCAPPSGSADYVADVKAALALWDGTGSFVFTSSLSVCAVDDGGQVTDAACPLVAEGAAASTDRLLGAEKAVIEGGGNVLRLVGLYHANRGAHTFFIKQGTVARPADYLVNLLHYEDAAGMAAAILRGDGSGPFRGRVFLGTDGHPISFGDMVEACFSSGVFPRVPVAFTGTFPENGQGRGKRVDNSASRAALGGWAPRYASFASFMAQGQGKDFYNTSGLGF